MLQCHAVVAKRVGESPQMILPYMILPILSPALIETPLQAPPVTDQENLRRRRSPVVEICVFRGNCCAYFA